MKALVTGGAGFIGSHLVERLLREGHEVFVVDDLSSGYEQNLPATLPPENLKRVDVTEFSFLVDEVPIPDVVYHLAAKARVIPSFKDPEEYFNNNVHGAFNMLEQCRLRKVKRFVFASSSSVYGGNLAEELAVHHFTMPLSPYAFTKLIGEQLLQQYSRCYGMETIAARFFNVYGPRMGGSDYKPVIQAFLDARSEGKPLPVFGDGSHRRDFTHVDDVVDFLIRAGTYDMEGKKYDVFNVGAGDDFSVMDVAHMIGGEVEHLPEIENEPKRTRADITKTTFVLGWQPKVDLIDGIKKLKELYEHTGN